MSEFLWGDTIAAAKADLAEQGDMSIEIVPGEYDTQIISASVKKSPQKGTPYIAARYKVLSGELVNGTLLGRQYLSVKSEVSRSIFMRWAMTLGVDTNRVSQFGGDIEGGLAYIATTIKGAKVRIRVKRDDKGYLEIKSSYPINDKRPAAGPDAISLEDATSAAPGADEAPADLPF